MSCRKQAGSNVAVNRCSDSFLGTGSKVCCLFYDRRGIIISRKHGQLSPPADDRSRTLAAECPQLEKAVVLRYGNQSATGSCSLGDLPSWQRRVWCCVPYIK